MVGGHRGMGSVMTIGLINTAKQWARTIKRDVHAVWLAARDPRTP